MLRFWRYPRLLRQCLAALEDTQRICRELLESNQRLLRESQESAKFWRERHDALLAEDRPWRNLITEIENLPPAGGWKN